jgi:hypothetical protein
MGRQGQQRVGDWAAGNGRFSLLGVNCRDCTGLAHNSRCLRNQAASVSLSTTATTMTRPPRHRTLTSGTAWAVVTLAGDMAREITRFRRELQLALRAAGVSAARVCRSSMRLCLRALRAQLQAEARAGPASTDTTADGHKLWNKPLSPCRLGAQMRSRGGTVAYQVWTSLQLPDLFANIGVSHYDSSH